MSGNIIMFCVAGIMIWTFIIVSAAGISIIKDLFTKEKE